MEVGFGMSLEQKQILSQSQIQSLEILAMDSMEPVSYTHLRLWMIAAGMEVI